MSPIRAEVVFRGHVQGVFFRATCERIARGFDVTGWVRNEPDGSVLLIAEGDRIQVQGFLAAIGEAKRANIESIERKESQPTGEFAEFSIRH